MTRTPVGRVTVRPSGIEFDVDAEEPVMAAAERQGVIWPTTCHGIAECRTCIMYVLDDDISAVVEPDSLERDALDSMRSTLQNDPERWRLACQTTLRGDATLRKPGVMRLD